MPDACDIEQIMERLDRIDNTLFGVPERNQRGLWERVNTTEKLAEAIDSRLQKITWLLVVGVIGAGLNIVLNAHASLNENKTLNQIKETQQSKPTPL